MVNDFQTKLHMVKYVDDATVSKEGAYPKPDMDRTVSTITTNLETVSTITTNLPDDVDLCVKWSVYRKQRGSQHQKDPQTISVLFQNSSRNIFN